MGQKIPDSGGDGEFPATAVIKVAGAMVQGVLQGVRLVKTKYGEKPIYSLKVTDADCKFKKGDAEAFPEAGELVDIFAPTRLARQLSKVQNGQTVTIRYAGQKKVGRGNPAHVFDVEVN